MRRAVPHHIALVMDGNGRWAKKRFLPRLAGHKAGAGALRQTIEHAMRLGVGVLTVFAFSSENWARPADEVSGLMELLGSSLVKEVPDLLKAGVRLYFVGDLSALSQKLQAAIADAHTQTAANHKLVLNVCLNYGGKWDVLQAASSLASKGLPLTEANLSRALALSHVPDPDLFIRTGGEQRLSNFLLWQTAYTELYFTHTLWPDFGAAALDAAIADFFDRERRFGKTSEQVSEQVSEQLSQ